MTINTSSLGGSGLPKWAADLTAPSTWTSATGSSVQITGLDPSSGLTTAISIPAKKGVMNSITLNSMVSEDYTIKLTIDGVVKWNDVWAVGNSTVALIGGTSVGVLGYDPCPFDNSFLLEIQSTSDTAINVTYQFREIL